MWRYLAAFAVGAAAEYLSDLLSIRWNQGTATRSFPFDRPRMWRHTGKMAGIGVLLLWLGAVDVGSVLGGPELYLTVLAGATVGGAIATVKESWRKWLKRDRKLRGPKSDEEVEE